MSLSDDLYSSCVLKRMILAETSYFFKRFVFLSDLQIFDNSWDVRHFIGIANHRAASKHIQKYDYSWDGCRFLLECVQIVFRRAYLKVSRKNSDYSRDLCNFLPACVQVMFWRSMTLAETSFTLIHVLRLSYSQIRDNSWEVLHFIGIPIQGPTSKYFEKQWL